MWRWVNLRCVAVRRWYVCSIINVGNVSCYNSYVVCCAVSCWGNNWYGQLGLGLAVDFVPDAGRILPRIKSSSSHHHHHSSTSQETAVGVGVGVGVGGALIVAAVLFVVIIARKRRKSLSTQQLQQMDNNSNIIAAAGFGTV